MRSRHFGDLNQVAVVGMAASFYFFFEFPQDLLIGVEFVHIVVREGEFRLQISIYIKHVYPNTAVTLFKTIN